MPAWPCPPGYGELLEQIKTEVRIARLRAARSANTELIALYWRVGRLILDRQNVAGWGARVVERLAADLRVEFCTKPGTAAAHVQYARLRRGVRPGDGATARCTVAVHVTVLLDSLSRA